MSLILLGIGALLAIMGKIHIGNFHVQGRHVRAAGIVLILPAAASFLLMLLFAMLLGNNEEALYVMLILSYALELIAMIIATGIAYILLLNPPNAPKLPGILGEIQAEAQQQVANKSTSSDGAARRPPQTHSQMPPSTTRQHPLMRGASTLHPAAPSAAKPLDRAAYPKVVTLTQAAQYLDTTEDSVRALINASKLPAVRSGAGYVIAKSVLDELIAEDQTF